MAWMDLCKFGELTEGEGKFVALPDRNVAVFLNEGKVHAFDDRCPHAGASLSGGFIEQGYVTCPWHYWAFSLEDGMVGGGGRARIRVYQVRLIGEGPEAVVQADVS